MIDLLRHQQAVPRVTHPLVMKTITTTTPPQYSSLLPRQWMFTNPGDPFLHHPSSLGFVGRKRSRGRQYQKYAPGQVPGLGRTVAHWETCQDWNMRLWREGGRKRSHPGKDLEQVGSSTYKGPVWILKKCNSFGPVQSVGGMVENSLFFAGELG